MVQLYSKVTDMNKDNDISNDDVSEYNNYNLNKCLEEYYDDVFKQIDEVAEHILMLNYEPLATMKDYLQNATLVEAQNKKVKEEEIFSVVMNDYIQLMKEAKDIKTQADEKQVVETSAFIDNYISDFNKKIWMIRQMMA